MALDLCRVVLVRPQIAGNLGATARVMRNFGLKDLVLVAPEADRDDRNARQMSTQGEEILDQAGIVADLGEALADCVLVAATSARTGGLYRRQSLGPPEDVLPLLAKSLAAGQPAALVFGPEATGLANSEVTRCHYLIHIPTDDAYPALNLAQAVAICLYELRCCCQRAGPSAGQVSPDDLRPAAFAAQERMFEQLRTALEKLHFLYGAKSASLMHALRHLLGRAQPTIMEVQILHGLARQILHGKGETDVFV
jgi:tRNA/rRNA methyltransferase